MGAKVLFTKKYDIYEINLTNEKLGILPCVIIQNDVGNKYSPTTIIMPLVKEKHNAGLYFKTSVKNLGEVYVYASSVQVIDKKRIVNAEIPISCIEDKKTKEKIQEYYWANAGMKKVKVNGEYQIVEMTQEELEELYEESRNC